MNDGFCVYVGNLNHSNLYEDIKNSLATYFMTHSLLVHDIRLDKGRKHAFVDLASEMDVNKALTLDGHAILDKPMTVSKPKAKEKVKRTKEQRKQAAKERTVFVQNIPVTATIEDVQKAFPRAQHIRFMGGTKTATKGVAFVQFNYRDLAKAVARQNGKFKIQGQVLQVNAPLVNINVNASATHSNTLFVRNLPPHIQEHRIKSIFKKAVEIRIARHEAQSSQYALVMFDSVADAEAAKEANKDRKVQGRLINIHFSNDMRAMGPKVTQTLFVTKLSESTVAHTLTRAFEGAVGARIIMDKDTKLSKKFGFVEFASPELCRKAKESAEDVLIDGSKVIVDFALDATQLRDRDTKRGKGPGAAPSLPKKSKKSKKKATNQN